MIYLWNKLYIYSLGIILFVLKNLKFLYNFNKILTGQ